MGSVEMSVASAINARTVPISVLIPTMNHTDSLMRTVCGFLAGTHIPAEVIVVDQTADASERERLREKLAALAVPVRYAYQEVPSLTAARNRAASMATQEYWICADDDFAVDEQTVKAVYDRFRSSRTALISVWDSNCKNQPSVLGNLFEFVSGGVNPFRLKEGHVTAAMLGGLPQRLVGEAPTAWAMGGFVAVRHSLIKAWDMHWDEELRGYGFCEDLDFSMRYCTRARQEGYDCIVTKAITATHMGFDRQQDRSATTKFVCMYVINRLYLSYKLARSGWCRLAIHWRNGLFGALMVARRKWTVQDLRAAYRLYCRHKQAIRAGDLSAVYQEMQSI